MAAVVCGSRACASARAAWHCLGRLICGVAVLIVAGLMASSSCQAQDAVKGEATLTVAGGYARLIVRLTEDVESTVTMAGTILVIRFKRPVEVGVGRLADAAPDYVGSARRDPDGSAIRLALSRKVTVNTMAAGERLFVDLLPDTWTGLPPSLPQDVVRELAERARVAERALRDRAEMKKRPPIRVRASMQPTFVRYVFEMPNGVGVSSTLSERRLAILFTAPLTFDLADAKLAAPPNVASIGQKADANSSTVDVEMIGDVDVHSFREEKNYIVDIGFQSDKAPELPKAAAALLARVAGPEKPGKDDHAPPPPAPIAAPTSESIAREAKLESKPAPAAKAEPAPKPAMAKVEPAPKAAVAEPAHTEPAKAEPAKPEPVAKTEPAASAEPAKPAAAHAEPAEHSEPAAHAAEAAAAPAKETPAPPAKEPAPAPKAVAAADSGAPVEARRSADGLRLSFSFAEPTPAALFRRGDLVVLVLDTTAPFDVDAIRREGGAVIGDVNRIPLAKGQAIRMRLNRPQLASLRDDDASNPGKTWSVLFSDSGQSPSQPLVAARNIAEASRASVSVALAKPGLTHRLVDPDAGDPLTVITALPPPRGFIRRQDFVEFSLLETIHGVAIQLNSDDVVVETGADQIMLTRPGGLTLSSADAAPPSGPGATRPMFDTTQWRKDQESPFAERLDALITASSLATGPQRTATRLDLARFYMARAMYPEAKGVLDLILVDGKAGQEDPVALLGHAAASALMGRPEQALKDIANPAISSSFDSQLWKAVALARQGKWADAREKFKTAQFAIAALPLDLQRLLIAEAMRASLEVKDFAGAASRASELELVGISPAMNPSASVMSARLDEAMGREEVALSKYQLAIASNDRAAASEARLRDIMLRQKRNELSAADALPGLETLAMTWRGDELEVKTQQMLARMYADLGRFRESLAAAKTATALQPNSETSRQAQDESRALFAQIFLGSRGEDMPPIDALATFYEFRELTPIGRRGDEMIRKLSDRLVAVDLLDQAGELLQYQVDKRLEGSARAQVAARLAMIYLMNRKPDRAIAALRSTRIADLAGEVRQQRLLLEARAQSDIGRHDLGLDIISNVAGREAIRLRSDIYWASRRWREASEQIELYLADRWRDFKPLSSLEKSDVIRAVVGYALADDALGLARFREKYAPLMNEGADQIAFDTASKPASSNSAEFSAIAKMAAGVDTLDGFLREMRNRFPDTNAKAITPDATKADPSPTGSLPAIIGVRQIPMTR